MSKLENMRGIEIPAFRAVSSGLKTNDELWGKGGFNDVWVDAHRHLFRQHLYEPSDFVWHEDGLSVWAFAIKDDVTAEDVAPCEIIDFPGGIFLVATGDESDNDDLEKTVSCMMDWIRNSPVFEYGDFPKSGMCNMPNPDGRFDGALGIAQQQIYLPLKFRQKQA